MKKTLTFMDVSGIQGYVFASNRLRDVVGGSLAVSEAVSEETGGLVWRANKETGGVVILSGGGNALLSFDSLDTAKKFAAKYSRGLFDTAPGLGCHISHYVYEEGEIAEATAKVFCDVALKKGAVAYAPPTTGFGFTERCDETGMAAESETLKFDDTKHVAFDVKKRRAKLANPDGPAIKEEQELLALLETNHIEKLAGSRLAMTCDNDSLGRSMNEKSILGVIHIDGNRVGGRIMDWMRAKIYEQKNAVLTDDDFIKEYKKNSIMLHNAMKSAFERVCDSVVNCFEFDENNKWIFKAARPDDSMFYLEMEGGKVVLPIRKVVLGGDDLTFICDGRIALDLAALALKFFSEHSDARAFGKSGASPIGACAGVAIVNTHAQFSRACELAGKLCSNAKRKLTDEFAESDAFAAIDWQIGIIPPNTGVDEHRKTKDPAFVFSGKPYPLHPPPLNDKNIEGGFAWLLDEVLYGSDGYLGEKWAEKRSKVKSLSEIPRRSAANMENAIQFTKKSWKVSNLPGEKGQFVDAIEIMDIAWRLT